MLIFKRLRENKGGVLRLLLQSKASLFRYFGQDQITVSFFNKKDNTLEEKHLRLGENLMEQARSAGVPIEAACEGSCACTTCHVILGKNCYRRSLESSPLSEKEDDLLDSATGLADTSRLSCQMKVEKYLDKKIITLPKFTKNYIK